MTVATRAAFTGTIVDATPRVIALTSPPDGGWTQVTEPHAIEHEGVLWFSFIDGDDGHIKVGRFDGTTTLATVGTAPGPTVVDTHNAPSIHIRPDGRLLVVWAGHDSSSIWRRVSTNPLDLSSWETATDIDSQLGGASYTYPSLMAVDGDIWLWFRDLVGGERGPCWSVSTDGGETWSARTILAQQDGRVPYFVVASDGDRLDMAISDGHVITDAPTSIHHLSWEDGAWRDAAGASLGSPPFTVSALPVVHDGAEPAWPGAIVTGPVFVYMVDLGSDWAYRVATWTGSSWQVTTLGLVGQDAVDGVVVALLDADTAVGSVRVGALMELHRWRRSPGWSASPITAGSAATNLFPVRVHGGTLWRVLWLQGTYTTWLDNSLRVMAGR